MPKMIYIFVLFAAFIMSFSKYLNNALIIKADCVLN